MKKNENSGSDIVLQIDVRLQRLMADNIWVIQNQ